MFDRIIAAKQELYNLGRLAEQKLTDLNEARDSASSYRLMGMHGNAAFEMFLAGQIETELYGIGKRQQVLMDFLFRQGEAWFM